MQDCMVLRAKAAVTLLPLPALSTSTEQVYAEQVRAEQVYAQQVYAEQVYTEQVHAEQVYTEQVYVIAPWPQPEHSADAEQVLKHFWEKGWPKR